MFLSRLFFPKKGQISKRKISKVRLNRSSKENDNHLNLKKIENKISGKYGEREPLGFKRLYNIENEELKKQSPDGLVPPEILHKGQKAESPEISARKGEFILHCPKEYIGGYFEGIQRELGRAAENPLFTCSQLRDVIYNLELEKGKQEIDTEESNIGIGVESPESVENLENLEDPENPKSAESQESAKSQESPKTQDVEAHKQTPDSPLPSPTWERELEILIPHETKGESTGNLSPQENLLKYLNSTPFPQRSDQSLESLSSLDTDKDSFSSQSISHKELKEETTLLDVYESSYNSYSQLDH